jgi:hypothetical protein
MKKSDATEQVITRRKALGRIGLFATAAYTVPAFATLSMAHASSGASTASGSTSDTSGSSGSGPSGSGPSVSGPSVSGPSISVPSDVEALCSEGDLASVAGDLTNPDYVQCLIDNGVDLGEGFVLPLGVTLS